MSELNTDNFNNIIYDNVEPGIARIVLNRTEVHNAQDTHLLYELNAAFDIAAADDNVKVIILAARGKHFSSGHDLSEQNHLHNWNQYKTVGTWCGLSSGGAEPAMTRERELFLGFSERWRNLPKPTIAQVHGKCIAGGLLLAWPCDLIIASDDAQFKDNTLEMGISGVEYFAHVDELGLRKAKEMLFTADWVSADEARQAGMVNRVVPRDRLDDETLALARCIADKPLFALRLVKQAANTCADTGERTAGMLNAFNLHQLSHSHNTQVHGMPIDPAYLEKTFGKSTTEQ